jgi:hypothetical protein
MKFLGESDNFSFNCPMLHNQIVGFLPVPSVCMWVLVCCVDEREIASILL